MKKVYNRVYDIIRHEVKLLREAAMDGFSFNDLLSLPSYKERIAYCKKMLGSPIGNGSSRIVFQISDERVLKVAKNEKGIAQNEFEAEYGKQNYDIFPKIFNVDRDDYVFIESEYVLPCKKRDFQKALGISFDKFREFIKFAYNTYSRGRKVYTMMSEDEFNDLVENNENLSDIYDYLGNYGLTTIGDLLRLANLGMVWRHGQEWIVILDDGLNETIFNDYYR